MMSPGEQLLVNLGLFRKTIQHNQDNVTMSIAVIEVFLRYFYYLGQFCPEIKIAFLPQSNHLVVR